MNKKRILIIEDNPIAARVATICLKNVGCELSFSDGDLKAIELLTTHHEDYDGVYMNTWMFEMNGIEICKVVSACAHYLMH